MKRFILMILLVICASCRHHVVHNEDIDKQQLIDLHNQARGGQLHIDPNLEKAAQLHSEWMARNKKLSHIGENRSDVADRVGEGFYFLGENIASHYTTESDVMRGWMNSKGHRQNILNKKFKAIGIGCSRTEDGTLYWCVVFAG